MKKIFSQKILKQSVRNSWKLWTILTLVLCAFIIMMITVYTNATAGGDFRLPLVQMLGSGFFGNMALIILIIYAITVGNKLVASEVDKGSMAFTLNTPITRKQIIFTKALFYFFSLLAMAVIVGVVGTITAIIVDAQMALGTYWLLVLGYFLLGFALSSICFFASCWFNKSGNSIMVGAGFCVAFFLLSSLSGLPDFEFFKYMTINTLYDTSAIISGGSYIIQLVTLGAIGVVLYGVGITRFLRKDLPL